MGEMLISELVTILRDIQALYPMAKVDFIYPKMRAGKRHSVCANMTGYEVLLGNLSPKLRICIDWAPTERRGTVEYSQSLTAPQSAQGGEPS